ncbi:MAG TPA: DnaJ domain-containing protein [Terriglobia bacterium]|nr:DnaJ domain-containing protein [Terriglobia bacterium]
MEHNHSHCIVTDRPDEWQTKSVPALKKIPLSQIEKLTALSRGMIINARTAAERRLGQHDLSHIAVVSAGKPPEEEKVERRGIACFGELIARSFVIAEGMRTTTIFPRNGDVSGFWKPRRCAFRGYGRVAGNGCDCREEKGARLHTNGCIFFNRRKAKTLNSALRMFIKTKECAGRTQFFLCIAERGGNNGSWKTIEYSVCLGESLNLSSGDWVDILKASPEFRSVPIEDVLHLFEKYVKDHKLASDLLSGLREAARKPRRGFRNGARSEQGPHQDVYASAWRALGLEPGASDAQIESAFRKAARRHHPDVGGDPARFRALVDARNLLLARSE